MQRGLEDTHEKHTTAAHAYERHTYEADSEEEEDTAAHTSAGGKNSRAEVSHAEASNTARGTKDSRDASRAQHADACIEIDKSTDDEQQGETCQSDHREADTRGEGSDTGREGALAREADTREEGSDASGEGALAWEVQSAPASVARPRREGATRQYFPTRKTRARGKKAAPPPNKTQRKPDAAKRIEVGPVTIERIAGGKYETTDGDYRPTPTRGTVYDDGG